MLIYCVRKWKKFGSQCWLVNTGWWEVNSALESVSASGTLVIILNAALDGKLSNVPYRQDKIFGFDVPLECPEVLEEVS
jgi:phosphoenolpyruvate carboxykinase (ATP)